MAVPTTPTRSLDLPIRRARVELTPATRGLASVDGWLYVAVAAICACGLVMVYSASEVLAYDQTGNPSYYFERQVAYLVLGVAVMLVLARLDYHHLARWSRPIGAVTVLMLLAVLVPHIGTTANGSRRWFDLGFFDLQPSAVAALAAIIVLGRWLADRGTLIRSWHGIRDYAILLSIPVALILLERDLGSTIVVAAVGGILLFLAGSRYRHLLILLAVAGAVCWVMVLIEPYRLSRLTCFGQSLSNDTLGTCWQGIQALYGLGRGGLFGVGLGNSVEKYSWLPEASTDFIFAIVGEELGLLGAASVVLAFTFLAWRGIRAARRAPDRFGTLLAGGVTAWICVQAFVNVAAVTVLIPATGIPLPFISYGGTALVMNLAAVGILCNVSAQSRRATAEQRSSSGAVGQGVLSRANADRRGRDGGTPDPRAGGRRRVARL
jgi:cell division protein FtsW